MANTKLTSGIVALVVTMLLVGGVVYAKNAGKTEDADTSVATTDSNPTTTTPSTTEDTTTSDDTDTAAPVATSAFKDGTYTASGSYATPESTEKITVTVTLKNDVIVDTSATANATKSDSKKYQARFISGYKSLVVGKKISDVQLDSVSGSSLTSNGFNKALDQIEQQAAA